VSAFGKVVRGRCGVRCDECGKFTKDPHGEYQSKGENAVKRIAPYDYYGLPERADENGWSADICAECAARLLAAST
jgi:hypothetical protein